jgi:hypothetical protein
MAEWKTVVKVWICPKCSERNYGGIDDSGIAEGEPHLECFYCNARFYRKPVDSAGEKE